MKQVEIKNCIFGNGDPKICVPLFGGSREEILETAGVMRKEIDRLEAIHKDKKVDVIEFRADFFDDVADRI